MRFEDDYENSRSEIVSLLALPRWSGFHFQIESLAAIDFYPGAAFLVHAPNICGFSIFSRDGMRGGVLHSFVSQGAGLDSTSAQSFSTRDV
jgi:hypothetical protein